MSVIKIRPEVRERILDAACEHLDERVQNQIRARWQAGCDTCQIASELSLHEATVARVIANRPRWQQAPALIEAAQ